MTTHDEDCAYSTVEWSPLLGVVFGPPRCNCLTTKEKKQMVGFEKAGNDITDLTAQLMQLAGLKHPAQPPGGSQ